MSTPDHIDFTALHDQFSQITAESPPSTPTRLALPPPSPPRIVDVTDMEEDSHSWTEGERIGEAKNPGPATGPRAGYPDRSRAPEGRRHHHRVRDEQRGARAAPTATDTTAGERTKGMYPGPKPHGDRRGNRAVGSAMGNYDFTAMLPSRSSRPGSAQGN